MERQKLLEEKAKKLLRENFEATGQRYICPSWPYHPWQWGWDSCFHAIACAHLGMSDLAKNEITKLFSVQIREGPRKGFIPHQIYWPNVTSWTKRGFQDIERFLYKGWMPRTSPLVTQPVLAQAVRSINDADFFHECADQLIDFYKYFQNLRDPDQDGLISIITPRESGRDSSPEFDFFRFGGYRAPRHLKFLDIANDIISVLWIEARYKTMGWDEKRILESHIFDVQDLVVQCIYIDGMYDLLWMMQEWDGSCDRYPDIESVIARAENAVLEKCWNSEDKTFYSLRNGGQQLQDLTIASLFPILIKDLPDDRVVEIVRALKDPKKFNTPYPVPTVAVSNSEFDGTSTLLIWRGPTWINTNWFLIRGLLRNGAADSAEHIAHKSVEMIERNGFREFYQPFTGRGMHVENFGWSTLAITFSKLIKQ